jgi:hypothetical protein
MKKAIIFILGVVIVGVLFFIFSGKGASKELPVKAETIFFYGDGCPHCSIVDDFISANQVEEKVKFEKGEIYHNKNNAEIFVQKARQCGIEVKNMGVPMLWEKGECYVGQEEVVQFFKDKMVAGGQETENIGQ